MFDGYRDAELVGEGGLGRLYRAIRISTGGPVAIKELRDVSSASAALHRARRELDALLKLKGHPYVVSVEEIIEGPNGPCIVMEYAPGGSLHDRVANGPLPAPEVVLVGQHVTQALAAAHDQGIIHRDVKPHNLLIGTFGQVKVCDFGIAALFRGPAGRTQTQAFTLAYASPEELDGDGDVGPPADAYSFSATMVHFITGRRPSFRDRLSGSGVELSLDNWRPRPGASAHRRSSSIRAGTRPGRPAAHGRVLPHLRDRRDEPRTTQDPTSVADHRSAQHSRALRGIAATGRTRHRSRHHRSSRPTSAAVAAAARCSDHRHRAERTGWGGGGIAVQFSSVGTSSGVGSGDRRRQSHGRPEQRWAVATTPEARRRVTRRPSTPSAGER